MQRPDTPDGLFHDGDPMTGQKGTPVPAAWLNALLQLAVVISGNVEPPAADLGEDGDFYLCRITRNFYGPKTAGEWGDAWTQGIPGPRGYRWYWGNGAPADVAGAIEQDFYLQLDNGDVWHFVGDVWGAIGNLRGPAGQQGPAGAAQNAAWADVLSVAQSVYGITGYDTAYRFNTAATAIAASVPTAVGNKGRRIYVENTGSAGNAVTLSAGGGQTIEGNASVDIIDGMGRELYSDGINWYIKKG